MSGSGRQDFLDVREWLGGPHECPGVVGRSSRLSGSGREASQMSRSGRETFPDVREWSGGPSGCPGVVGRTFRMFGSGRESLPDVQE